MKRMKLGPKRGLSVRLALVAVATVLVLLWGGCAPSASPPPAPTPTSAAPPAAKATPAPAPAATPSPLAQIIEGAKKEGKVSVTLLSDLAGKGIERLKKEIKERYGVDLQIDYEPVGSYPVRLAKAITEYKAGAIPTFDLMVSSDLTIGQAIDAGIVEKVDWKPLLVPGTPPEVIQWDGYALSSHTGHIGMAFNPKVIPPGEAPKSFGDLGNPKWRGKIAAYNYPTNYLTYVLVRGEERALSELRAMMKNEPVLDIYARTITRYLAGEYPILLTASSYYERSRQQGVPVEWRSLDVSWFSIHANELMKRAAHPNAAKLVAVFLASPEGHKFLLEEGLSGSMFYPANYEHDIQEGDVKAGLPVYNPQQWPGGKEFLWSEKASKVEEEIGRILKGE